MANPYHPHLEDLLTIVAKLKNHPGISLKLKQNPLLFTTIWGDFDLHPPGELQPESLSRCYVTFHLWLTQIPTTAPAMGHLLGREFHGRGTSSHQDESCDENVATVLLL